MKARYYILVGILLLGFGLRTIRVAWPATPVTDEMHFATYAADYLEDQPFYDIHPPLGKLIYAATLYVAGGWQGTGVLGNTNFVMFNTSSSPAASTLVSATDIPFGSFPYVPLRIVSAAFGVMLIFAFYWFLRSIGVGETGALLGAFFVAIDNALVLQTKLILLDGMYLAFGFLALAWYLKKPNWPVAAGLMLGLSLGVKLIGVVFIGPAIIEYLLTARSERHAAGEKLRTFLLTGGTTLGGIALLNFLFFSPSRFLAFINSIGGRIPVLASPILRFFAALITITVMPWTGYIQGGSGPYGSRWFSWPAMLGPMYYYSNKIVLFGNPVIWIASTIAVVFAIALLPRYIRRRHDSKEARTFFALLGGYLIALLPFFTFVQRTTFLYHYFPALLFAFGLLAWMIARWLKLTDIHELTGRQWFYLGTIIALAICGFLAVAPFTYGL